MPLLPNPWKTIGGCKIIIKTICSGDQNNKNYFGEFGVPWKLRREGLSSKKGRSYFLERAMKGRSYNLSLSESTWEPRSQISLRGLELKGLESRTTFSPKSKTLTLLD